MWPPDARKKKLNSQFGTDDIYDLLQRGRIVDVGLWISEEIAKREWSLNTAQCELQKDIAHIYRVIHHSRNAGRDFVINCAIKFGYADGGSNDRVDFILRHFGFRPLL